MKLETETLNTDTKPKGPALEELIESQVLNTDLKPALLACLSGNESRRWTTGELFERLNNLGLRCSKPAVAGALGELELEMALCPFLPWALVECGTEWSLSPKSELLELLSGVRKLPGISADTLNDEAKAVLLVVIGYRQKGGVSKTRIQDILKLDPSPHLDLLWKKELVYTAPGKELNWWRPTPEALLALGLRSYSDIPELKALEQWFDSQKNFGNDEGARESLEPIFQKANFSQARRQRRELERRASAPVSKAEDGKKPN
jgi:chromosome segregation and condensation protein ScpB